MPQLDVVVVGAGQAGLGIGYYLKRSGLSFVILERGAIGESWRSQRWDSFAVNTPNRINGLPGSPYRGDSPDGFYLRDELVASFERHAADHDLPVRLGITVERVSQNGAGLVVEAVDGAGIAETLLTRNVVVASGGQQSPKIPAISDSFPAWISQIHAGDYRSAGQLPAGAVIVVGSAQSGCQIAEDLSEAGRTVYLCTSSVGRVPRRYRGRDAAVWLRDTGKFDERIEDLPDPHMQFAAQPQVSGVGPAGRTVSLQALQRRGVQLMGRLSSVTGTVLTTDDSLADHIAFADEFSEEFKRDIDTFIGMLDLDSPEAELDPADVPAGPEVAAAGLTTVDLRDADVGSVIWCTGFKTDLDWLEVPVLDDAGRPVHTRGVSDVPGIYFLGFPWLHTRKSGIILGIDEDASHIAEAIGSNTSGAVASS